MQTSRSARPDGPRRARLLHSPTTRERYWVTATTGVSLLKCLINEAEFLVPVIPFQACSTWVPFKRVVSPFSLLVWVSGVWMNNLCFDGLKSGVSSKTVPPEDPVPCKVNATSVEGIREVRRLSPVWNTDAVSVRKTILILHYEQLCWWLCWMMSQ